MQKTYTLLVALALLMVCCRKNSGLESTDRPSATAVQQFLKDSLSAQDYALLDYGKLDQLVVDSAGRETIWRVPFKSENPEKSGFVTVQFEGGDHIIGGRIVRLDQTGSSLFNVNGSVSVTWMNGNSILTSEIQEGYITALHRSTHDVSVNSTGQTETMVVPASAGGQALPEVLVVAYLNSNSGSVSLANYMKLITYQASGPQGSAGTVSTVGGVGGVGSGSFPVIGSPNSPNTAGNSVNLYAPSAPNGGSQPTTTTSPVDIEPDYTLEEEIIDIRQLLKCFDNVPSAGAAYKITINADLPVNTNPDYVTLGTTSGHTFLTLSKTNGSQTITQSFGFYPAQNPSVLNPFGALSSGIKDNGKHEINASLSLTLTESQFNTAKNIAIQQSTNDYTLSGYNCTTFALTVFNSVRSSPITVSPLVVHLPANTSTYNPSPTPETVTIPFSPQALFVRLQQLKTSGGGEAANITIDQTHNTKSPSSHGTCD